MHFTIIYANARRDAIVLTFPSAHYKTLVFYSFACQYCNGSFVIVFSYLEPPVHTHTHTLYAYMVAYAHAYLIHTGLFLRTFEF